MAQTPLHNQTSRDSNDEENYMYVDKVRQLLGEGIYTVNCTDSRGQTPLHCACTGGHLKIVGMLIAEFRMKMVTQH